MSDLNDPIIRKALLRSVLAASEALTTIAEILDDEPAETAPAATPADPRHATCKHRERESLEGFGGHNAGRWRCRLCGHEGGP